MSKLLLIKNWVFKYKHFFIGLLLSLSLLWPLFVSPYFTHHDDVQVIRVFEMNKCFLDHQLPCRWVPDLGGVYGYPIFNYYAPLPYYFGELIYFLTHSLLISAKVMFAFPFIFSYIFMYLLASKYWGKTGGLISAVFYAYAPYHALDFYVRGAMGEMWSLMFFPAIFWAIDKLRGKITITNLLLLAVLFAGLITSHNLSAMIFLPLCLVWIGLNYAKERKIKFLYFSLVSLVLSILLSAFYFFPVIFEKNLVHLETTVEGYFSYTEHFKGFRKLFLERTWGYGASIREVPGGERDGLSYQIGWVHLLGWFLALFTARTLWRSNRWVSIVITFSSLAILISVFMINPRSEFIWNLVDPLKYLQFPWRFLIIVIFFISFIAGSFTLTFLKGKKYIWLLLLLMMVVLNFFYFRPEKFIQTSDSELLSGKNWDKQIKRSIFDYLPIYAKEPPAELATKRYEILTGDTKIVDFKEGTNWISFNTNTKTHSIIRLSQYYFPDWKIFIDGKEAKIEYKNNSLGLMTIILGMGNHKIEARLYDTPVRSISNLVSALTAFLMMFLFLFQLKQVKKWVEYYRKRIN